LSFCKNWFVFKKWKIAKNLIFSKKRKIMISLRISKIFVQDIQILGFMSSNLWRVSKSNSDVNLIESLGWTTLRKTSSNW
jgi:hypothetical protein